ncbi:hypothetical protein Tcan_01149, partial [Toxocara canis]
MGSSTRESAEMGARFSNLVESSMRSATTIFITNGWMSTCLFIEIFTTIWPLPHVSLFATLPPRGRQFSPLSITLQWTRKCNSFYDFNKTKMNPPVVVQRKKKDKLSFTARTL